MMTFARFQELRDKMAAQAEERDSFPPCKRTSMQPAKYDEAINRVSELQAELDKALEALGDEGQHNY